MLSVLRSRTRLVLSRSTLNLQPRRTSSFSTSSVRRLWTSYASLLETHPLRVKIVTGGVIAGLGDVICQLALENNERYLNVKRVAIFTFVGGVLISPVLHVWYRLLSTRLPGISATAIAKRLAMDQLGFAPMFLPIFISSVMTLEGRMEFIPDKLKTDWWPITKANWIVWVPAQLVNFRFVPGSMQVLFSNVMGLFWNAYLSYVSHSEVIKPTLAEDKSMDEDKIQV
ncbi:unnamed protein product [Peronospora farinosa]|uniref:Uncharacterized protein n=1 Tax=Peronospora farinosa TaxID=134698 RepID=A0AAV0TAA5_9STRA|nr:unnamed protein product [Peronospora farinosa]CAI5718107.1 unnamed protein product [Peronospora farinosa]